MVIGTGACTTITIRLQLEGEGASFGDMASCISNASRGTFLASI
jgi:hypothetical protein